MKVLKAIGRWVRNYFIFVGVMVTLLSILLAINIARSFRSTSPSYELPVQKEYSLDLKLSGEVTSNDPDVFQLMANRFFGGRDVIYLSELRRVARAIKADQRVTKISVSVEDMMASTADIVELRRIFADLRGDKREITFHLHDGNTWMYYLATAGNRIILNPAASLFITGPYFNLVYMGDLLQKKIGFELQVFKAGKYKSAFEPFVANEPSEATLEEYRAMEASLRSFLISELAKARNVSEDEAKDWLATGIYTAAEAKQTGLIDDIGYPESDDTAISFQDYGLAKEDSSIGLIGDETDGIGFIEARGEVTMVGGDGVSDESVNPKQMTRELDWMRKQDKVKAVVLRIDSPGGSAVAADMIWSKVRELAAKKPVVVSMGDVAASGGYYIAAPAKQIFAEPTTITGSIGVISALPNLASMREKWGISFHIVTQSLRENLLDPGSAPTQQDVELLNRTVDQVYETFMTKVAEGRNMKLDLVAELAQGRVYTGLQAKTVGLVDEVGGVQDAFQAAKKLGGLDPEKLYPVHEYTEEGISLSDCLSSPAALLRCFRGQASVESVLKEALATEVAPLQQTGALDTLQRWSRLFRPREVLMLWGGYRAVRP